MNTQPKDSTSRMNRRRFISGMTSSALAFTIVPRHVLGGPNFLAPSDKVNLAYIGLGTQGIREMLPLLTAPDIQIVAVCDPNKDAVGYRDWGKNYIRDGVRKLLNNPNWTSGGDNVV